MTEKVDTWMPLLVDKYLGDTTHLSTEQHGAYLLLLMSMWKRGGRLPADDAQLANIARLSPAKWRAHRTLLMAFFTVVEGGAALSQKRLSAELARAKKTAGVKGEAGAKGAASKWGEKASTAAATRSRRLAEARAKGTHTREEWEALKDVLGHRCVVCAASEADLEGGALTKDHITPIYQGGDDSIMNLQPMCRNCNSRKGSDCRDHRETSSEGWAERLAERLAKRLANASQTPAPIPIPSSLRSETPPPSRVGVQGEGGQGQGQEPADPPPPPSPPPPQPPPPSTPYGTIAKEIRKAGIQASPGHLRFRALVDAGATAEEFLAYVDKAKTDAAGAPWPYLLAVVENERKRVAEAAGRLHRGPMPAADPAAATVPSQEADATQAYLARQQMSEEDRARAEEARRATMAKLRHLPGRLVGAA